MSGDEDTCRGELRKRMTGEILFDEPADRHTSIGVGGRIDALVFPKDEGELAEIGRFSPERAGSLFFRSATGPT